MSDLEKERLKENQLEKAEYEKQPVEPIKGLKSVELGVKSHQIVLGISNGSSNLNVISSIALNFGLYG